MNGKRLDAIFACVGGGGLLSGLFTIVTYHYVLLRLLNFTDFYKIFVWRCLALEIQIYLNRYFSVSRPGSLFRTS